MLTSVIAHAPLVGRMLLQSGGGSPDVTGMMSNAMDTVKTDVMGILSVALPIALGIAGIFLAVKLGIKFFKRTSN